jgi:cellulose synthase/poly-beta-1,6-N-acetylglucosamine synthase-like glycosyltransferase
VLLGLVALPSGYLFLLAAASVRAQPSRAAAGASRTRFAIAIPAHDEAAVIRGTVESMLELHYPKDHFDVHVVADHCSDGTAEIARRAGAIVHNRDGGTRGGKAAAVKDLFEAILPAGIYDAVVVFDADTRPGPDFLSAMDNRLRSGARVIQGRQVIRNPDESWYPALVWAMYIIDNRFQNLGRVNLGWSAKHMGDSICFRTEVPRELGWGEGLTEDYHLRQRMLLEGIRISYEPAAIGRSLAPLSLRHARHQRARWISGPLEANQRNARLLLRKAWLNRDGALLDGALQAYLPSYSTLALLTSGLLVGQWLGTSLGFVSLVPGALLAWGSLAGLLIAYPFLGLVLERAPGRAYAAILLGPFFILWRTAIVIWVRLHGGPVKWIRTPHTDQATDA